MVRVIEHGHDPQELSAPTLGYENLTSTTVTGRPPVLPRTSMRSCWVDPFQVQIADPAAPVHSEKDQPSPALQGWAKRDATAAGSPNDVAVARSPFIQAS